MQETIKSTKDYKQFKHMRGNRAIDHTHVSHLKTAISENNMLDIRPIIVDEDMVIIDGQHRLEAAKELGVPIYYITRHRMSIEDVQTLNSNTKNWSVHAYLESFCSQGKEDYLMLKGFCSRWSISISEGLHLLGSGHRNYKEFTAGLFKCRNLAHGNKTMELVYSFERWYKGFKRRAFVLACANLADNPDYNHEQMMKKLEFQSSELVDCTNTTAYLKLLERIYNFKSRDIVHFDVRKHDQRIGGRFAKEHANEQTR